MKVITCDVEGCGKTAFTEPIYMDGKIRRCNEHYDMEIRASLEAAERDLRDARAEIARLQGYVQHKSHCKKAMAEKFPRCTCKHSEQSHTFAGRDKPPYCRFCRCSEFVKDESAACTCGLLDGRGEK